MADIKQFPVKRSQISEIAAKLVKLGPKVRTLVVLGRETDGELFTICHSKADDISADDLLVLQRVMNTVVDSVWDGSLDIEPGG